MLFSKCILHLQKVDFCNKKVLTWTFLCIHIGNRKHKGKSISLFCIFCTFLKCPFHEGILYCFFQYSETCSGSRKPILHNFFVSFDNKECLRQNTYDMNSICSNSCRYFLWKVLSCRKIPIVASLFADQTISCEKNATVPLLQLLPALKRPYSDEFRSS